MDGKVVLVTGANGGIGRATAEALARKGASVWLMVRDRSRGDQVRDELVAATGNAGIRTVVGDLASLGSVAEAARQLRSDLPRLDVLVNNAGISLDRRQLSADGHELTWATNHLGPFLLTNELLPLLKQSPQGRVVTVSSSVQSGAKVLWDDPEYARTPFGMMAVYGQSKLLNVIWTFELARRLAGTAVTANCLHPGVVQTALADDIQGLALKWFFRLSKPFFSTPAQGAALSVQLASDPGLAGISGKYFEKGKVVAANPMASDPAVGERLWKLSEGQVAAALARHAA